jgi:hypothetical protein
MDIYIQNILTFSQSEYIYIYIYGFYFIYVSCAISGLLQTNVWYICQELICHPESGLTLFLFVFCVVVLGYIVDR